MASSPIGKSMPSFVRDSTVTLATRGLVFILAMITSVVISRLLGPSQKGTYSLLVLIINTLVLIFICGLGSANVYLGARDQDRLPALAGNSLAAALFLGGLGVMLTSVIVQLPTAATYLQNNGIDPIWLLALSLAMPLLLVANFFQEIVRASGNIIAYNLISLIAAAAALVGAVIFVWYRDWGIQGAVMSWLIARMAMTLAAITLALVATRGRLQLDPSLMRQSLHYGLQLHPGNVAQFLNYRLDILLIGYFLAPLQVGLYVTATNLTERIWEFPHALRTVLLHRVAASDDPHAHDAMTAQITRITASAVGALCVVIALLSYPLILALYGTAFLPAAPALVLLLPGVWALSLGKLLAIHLAGAGLPRIGTTAAVVSLLATLLLDLLLIPSWGIIGAAIASSVAYLLSAVLIVRTFLATTDQTLRQVIIIQRNDWRQLTAAVSAQRGGHKHAPPAKED